ncbi:hypothetical protein B0H12DRAFT_1234727 [Mycena haematopus]|nr:hypothetical protein B0H12DRAFT_1234727 [Mycena haematopus]
MAVPSTVPSRSRFFEAFNGRVSHGPCRGPPWIRRPLPSRARVAALPERATTLSARRAVALPHPRYDLNLDILLPQHPILTGTLGQITQKLSTDWDGLFGDNTFHKYDGHELATTDASLLLLVFGVKAFPAIQTTTNAGGAIPTTTDQSLKLCRKLLARAVSSFEIDNFLCLDLHQAVSDILGIEDKRPSLLPRASMELVRRGLSCGVVDVELATPKDQPNWWLVANKGTLYAAAYDMDWVIVGGMTVYCVGHRIGDHMLWCPIYNRRDQGDSYRDEVIPKTTQALGTIFGEEPSPADPQTGLPLLILTVILRGIMADSRYPWLAQMFPNLSGLAFAIPQGAPDLKDYNNFGRDPWNSSDESSSDSDNDGDDSGRRSFLNDSIVCSHHFYLRATSHYGHLARRARTMQRIFCAH